MAPPAAAVIPISVVIITRNEERNIERCLASVKGVADEILVVDSLSSDRTAEICRAAGARFVEHAFEGYVEQKNYALALARHDHVLSLDADEALTPELAASIAAAKRDWRHDGYWMNRLTNYCGVWVRHAGWYPDPKLRLFDRRKAEFRGVNPHDHAELKDPRSTSGHLAGDLLHYSYYTVDEHYRQMEHFAEIYARTMQARGESASALRPPVAGVARFIRNYVLRLGFLDGRTGLTVCRIDAWGAWLKYARLRELRRRGAGGLSGPVDSTR